jgi:hypothetical protein
MRSDIREGEMFPDYELEEPIRYTEGKSIGIKT